MKTKTVFLLVILFLAGACIVAAQEKTDPVYEAVKPLLKQNTVVVGHVNLEKLGYDRMLEKMQPLLLKAIDTAAENTVGKDNEKVVQMRAQTESSYGADTTQASIDAMIAWGLKEFYVLSILDFVKDYPAILAVPGELTVTSEMEELMKTEDTHLVGVVEGFTLFVTRNREMSAAMAGAMPGGLPGMGGGMPGMGAMSGTSNVPEKPFDADAFLNVFNRLKPMDGNATLEAEFKIHSNSPVRIVFVPTKGLKAMAQLAASMSLAEADSNPMGVELDSEKIVNMIRHFEGASLGFAPGSLRLNGSVLFDSEESAKEVHEMLTGIFDAVAAQEIPEVGDDNPFGVIMAMVVTTIKAVFNPVLLPEVNGERLVLRINEKKLSTFMEDFMGAMMPLIAKMDSFQMNVGPMGSAGADDDDDDDGGFFD